MSNVSVVVGNPQARVRGRTRQQSLWLRSWPADLQTRSSM